MFKSKKRGLDSEYKEFIKETTAKVPQQFRGQVEGLLSSKKAAETYEILEENHLPDRVIDKVMMSGLEDFERDRHLSPGNYAAAVAEELKKFIC